MLEITVLVFITILVQALNFFKFSLQFKSRYPSNILWYWLSISDYPSVLANFTFALGIPLGHTLTHKYGFKRNYLCFVFIFLIGSILGLLSFNLIILSIAKMIQSFSSGVLFFTLLPKLFLNFPKQYRNVFLLMVIVGLFGSNALGGLSGSLSLELDRWHWIFVVNIISAILCLILGNVILRKMNIIKHQIFILVDQ